MEKSEHDKVAERIREEERLKLIDHYTQQAIEASHDYGFLNVRGHEVPDPTVLEPPIGYVATPDIFEQMRRMVRNELSKIAEAQEFETFEEADDFDIDDDPVDYASPYEMYFDPGAGGPAGPPQRDVRPDPNAEAPPPPKDGEVLPPDPGGGGAEPPGGQAKK